MTKREFKNRSSVHVYGHRKDRRILALFFDWKEGEGFRGFKHMIKCIGGTQKELINDAYDMLIKKDYSNLCWYDTKEAKTDAERFKVPLSM